MTEGPRYWVTAVPMETSMEHYTIECTQCGVVSLEAAADVDAAALDHLRTHNVDVSRYL